MRTHLTCSMLLAFALTGCGKKDAADVIHLNVAAPEKSTAAKQVAPELHVPFREATFAEPPIEARFVQPASMTSTKKIVGKLQDQIVGVDGKPGLWEQVKFVTADGKKIKYTAEIKTEHGTVHMDLFGDLAPSHVRNFICLAKVGFYDGLTFDRIVKTEIDGQPWTNLEAGCPVGSGDDAYGNIGYWMKPEITDKLSHEPGTLGAWHSFSLETAGTKFYITLNKAPWLDGNYTIFGKVTRGLDVLRTISQLPNQEDGLKDRPKNPVVMQTVTIHATVDDSPSTAK